MPDGGAYPRDWRTHHPTAATAVDFEPWTPKPGLWFQWDAVTSDKHLNFAQRVKALLKMHGRAAVVVPDTCSAKVAQARLSDASSCTSATFTPCCACRRAFC